MPGSNSGIAGYALGHALAVDALAVQALPTVGRLKYATNRSESWTTAVALVHAATESAKMTPKAAWG